MHHTYQGAKKTYTPLQWCDLLSPLDVELTYGSSVQDDVRPKDGVNQTNAGVTLPQAGQSKTMAEAQLLERKTTARSTDTKKR